MLDSRMKAHDILSGVKAEGKYVPGFSEHTIGHYLGSLKRASVYSNAGLHALAAEESAWAAILAGRDLCRSQMVDAAGMAIKESLVAAVEAFHYSDGATTRAFIDQAENLINGHLRRE